MGHSIDLYSLDNYKQLITLPNLSFYESIDEIKIKLKEQRLKNGKYDCIILANNFLSDDKLTLQDIKHCVKNNTICIKNNVIYGSYDVIINSQI
jgi:hypothetical protein